MINFEKNFNNRLVQNCKGRLDTVSKLIMVVDDETSSFSEGHNAWFILENRFSWRSTDSIIVQGVTIKGDHEAQNFHWQYSSKLDEYVGTFRVSTLCYPSPHHSILLTRSSLSGWDTSAFPIVLPRYASTRYARATSRRALDNAIVAAGWHNSGSIINETSATNLEQAIAVGVPRYRFSTRLTHLTPLRI